MSSVIKFVDIGDLFPPGTDDKRIQVVKEAYSTRLLEDNEKFKAIKEWRGYKMMPDLICRETEGYNACKGVLITAYLQDGKIDGDNIIFICSKCGDLQKVSGIIYALYIEIFKRDMVVSTEEVKGVIDELS